MSIAGGLYWLGGVGFLFPLLHALSALASGFNPLVAGYVAFLLLNVTICFRTGWGFYARKRWGRPSAIGYNGFWLILFLSGPIQALYSGRSTGLLEMPRAGLVVSLGILSIPIAIIFLCLQPRVKAAMVN